MSRVFQNFLRVGLTLLLAMCIAPSHALDPGHFQESTESGQVLTGIDILQREKYNQLWGRRVGLITNQTGIDRTGTRTVDRLRDVPGVHLVALFSPEHGFHGTLDIPDIADETDSGTGLKVFSLYGKTRKPTADMLDGIDTLIFDIQDIGTRYYTYISTLGLAMQAAAEIGVRFMVLDRPNPIDGVTVSGPVAEPGRNSFTAFHELPVRHGMTVGELSLMFRAELQMDLELEIIAMEGWQRNEFFDRTGLRWVNPSPNMRNLTQALLYPGVGLLETTNLSVGRGTDTPFEVIGAPWLQGEAFARAMNQLALYGVRFVPVRFTPDVSKFAGESCGGINIIITDRAVFDPLQTGLELASMLRRMYPDNWDLQAYDRLLVNSGVHGLVQKAARFETIEQAYAPRLEQFLERRAAFLIYSWKFSSAHKMLQSDP